MFEGTSEIEKQLSDYNKELEQRLIAMVAGFAGDVALAASNQTAVGDVDKYLKLYERRQKAWGLPVESGYHSGAWEYTEGSLEFTPVINPKGTVQGGAKAQALVQYKVGDAFTIGAIGPAFGMLQSRDDIDAKTMDAVQSAYASNLKQHFDNG
jgi:hypothetical protein